MSAYYTAVYLKIRYQDTCGGNPQTHYHRIEATKLLHYFAPGLVPTSYDHPVWNMLKQKCKKRCNKLVFRNCEFVGEPSTEKFYMRHIVDALQQLAALKQVERVEEVWAKMYPWSDECDQDTIRCEKSCLEQELGLEEVSFAEIPLVGPTRA